MRGPIAACSDPELEARYLGGAMLDPRLFEQHPLPSGCFGDRYHREVHAAMSAIAARGEAITEDRLDAELAARALHSARARRPFESMALIVPDDPAAICERLRALAARRALIEGCHVAVSGLERGESILAVQAHLARLADLEVDDEDRTASAPMSAIADASLEETKLAAAGEARATVTTGLPALDASFVGWDRGDVIIVAGDSGAGKSTTMLLMGRAQARSGERVLIVTVEDGRTRWGRRALYSASGVAVRALKVGDLTGGQWGAAAEGVQRLRDEAVWIAAPLGGGLDEVVCCIRRARAQHGITVAYVDYLQAIACGDSDQDMRHHIRDCLEAGRRETSRGTEPLTLVYGSQYRKREDETKRPRNSDLYEANYISQKADAIVHLWRLDDGERRWHLGKHKDEDPRTGSLVRDPNTGLLGGGPSTPSGGGPQRDFEDEWRRGTA